MVGRSRRRCQKAGGAGTACADGAGARRHRGGGAEGHDAISAAQRDYVRGAEHTRHAISMREQAIWRAATEAGEATFGELERAIAAAQSAEVSLAAIR